MSLLNSFTLYGISSGSSIELASFTGIGNPRLFENNGLYVYNLSGQLLESVDGGMTLTNIIPSNAGAVRAISQTGYDDLHDMTHIFADKGSFKHTTPESTSGWVLDNTLPTGTYPVDAVSDIYDTIPIVVGNTHSGTEPRVARSDSPAYGPFVQSDSGLIVVSPQVKITDLETTI